MKWSYVNTVPKTSLTTPKSSVINNNISNVANTAGFTMPPKPLMAGSIYKILVVDDDKICQLVHTNILEKAGYQTTVAGTGEQALAILNDSFSAIVLDVDLPGMSGLEVSQSIREQEQHRHILIIGLTSHGYDLRQECLRAGYDVVLTKPADQDALTTILKQRL